MKTVVERTYKKSPTKRKDKYEDKNIKKKLNN